jgi:hypothetical protein
MDGDVHGGHDRGGSVTGASRFLIGLVACLPRPTTLRFDSEFSAGRALSRDDAFGLAFGESARVVAASSHRVGKGVLGKREIEVAPLSPMA